jgi:hypothetical protein
MRAAIDIVLLAILAYCTWAGYKKGLINTAAGVIAIIVALYAGSLVSSAFSVQLVPAFQPFASGIIDTKSDEAVAAMGYGDAGMSLDDIVAAEPAKKYDYCLNVYKEAGMQQKRAEKMAEQATELSNEKEKEIRTAAEKVFCSDILYVAGSILAGLLIIIIFIVVANLANLTFHIPNAPKLEIIGGGAAGFVQGLLLCVLLCWILSFCGMFLGSVLDRSILTRFFLLFGFVTAGIL